MKSNYYLNTELIQQVMQEKNLSINQLAEMSGITARRLKRYVYGTNVNHVPFSIGLVFREILDIKFENMMIKIPHNKKDGK